MNFWNKVKKIFSWIPFLWKMDDGSYISLYMVNIKQMGDMQKEILRFSDVYPDGVDFCFQIEESRRNFNMAMKESDPRTTQRYADRAFEIMKQNSLNWWI